MVTTETIAVISTLNDLIAACAGSASRFRRAAGNVKAPILNAQFNSYARQRDLLAQELRAKVCDLEKGSEEEEKGPPPATPRAWVPSRPVATDPNANVEEGEILGECIREEDAVLAGYARGLRTALPDDIRAVLERQHEVIRESRHQLDALRERLTSEMASEVAGKGRPIRGKRRGGRDAGTPHTASTKRRGALRMHTKRLEMPRKK